jgi:hypothetical protein
LFLALSLCVAQATLVLSFAQDTGVSVREETTTLENLYQEKVRSILSNLMAPEDYTLVISATIRNDDTKLKEYSAAAERKFLPGLPIQDPAGYAETNNILLELKQRVEIQVILTDNVPADRDQIVRDVIKNKLKLNEETGDSIAVVRAARSIPAPKTQESPKLPELSAKMIAFWIIVLMMVLTGVMARVEGRVTEWNSEGLVFTSDRPFPEGTRLKLVVALSDSTDPKRILPLTVPLRVTFHVISGMVFRMTCRFEAMDPTARDMVDALLMYRPVAAV